jgi:hypothetical protein
MGILNRRNAVVGWAAIKAGKYFAKKKARGAVPGAGSGSGAGKKIVSGLAAAIAALGGALMFWRRRRESGEGPSPN